MRWFPRVLMAIAAIGAIVIVAITVPGDAAISTGTPAPASPAAMASPLAWQSPAAVEISRHVYRPRVIEISVGATVIWTNLDGTSHTVTDLVNRRFDSGLIPRGGTFQLTFDKPGRHGYECFYHKDMTGVVVVR